MRKRLVCMIALSVGAWLGTADLAEASCAGSSIWIGVPGSIIAHAIPVIWRIEPVCDVIETGLLLGTQSTELSPVGQPIYGQRAGYQQEIPVAETGEYWIAAYARDEAGDLIQSPTRLVIIVVPPRLSDTPHGSHGAPPSYAGTDEDFLQPAGQPHFASIRSSASARITQFGVPGTPAWFGFGQRTVSSTHRDEVPAQQEELVIGDVTVHLPLATVENSLSDLDGTFQSLGYPRPGIYIVQCEATAPLGGYNPRSAMRGTSPARRWPWSTWRMSAGPSGAPRGPAWRTSSRSPLPANGLAARGCESSSMWCLARSPPSG